MAAIEVAWRVAAASTSAGHAQSDKSNMSRDKHYQKETTGRSCMGLIEPHATIYISQHSRELCWLPDILQTEHAADWWHSVWVSVTFFLPVAEQLHLEHCHFDTKHPKDMRLVW